MPINNINTLQNYEDLRFVSYMAEQFKETGELNTDYYIHALANLEQRTEYRYSNGIKYGILTFDENDVRDKAYGVPSYSIEDFKTSTSISMTLNNELTFDIPVNNVESYLKNSSIYNNGKIFKTLMFCKILGTDTSSVVRNVEIQYTSIDLSTHTLIAAYRAFHLSDNIFVLLTVDRARAVDGKIYYVLKCNKLKIEQTDLLYKYFNHETYLGDSLPDATASVEDEINADNCTDEGSLFDSLLNMSIYNEETIDNNYTIICEYDTVEEQYIKIINSELLSKAYRNINDLLYFNYYKIDNYVTAINNDLTISYPNLLKYYSNRQFNSNSTILKDMIARSLFYKIYNDLINDENFSADQLKNARLEIPIGTNITYVSNVENSLMVHYTDDIYVFFINDDLKNISLHNNDTSIKFIYPGIDKTVLYNILSKYNTKYTDLIDSFIVVKKYTLPFIDDSHLWNINGNQTSIYASGESGGNPNILITRTYIGSDGDVHGIHLNRTDIQQNMLDYKLEQIAVKYKNPATDAIEIYNYVFAVPEINERTLDKLKYATLFIISDVQVSSDSNSNEQYTTAPMMTTIWTISDNNTATDSSFELVRINGTNDDEDQPLTIESMFGVESYIYRKFAEYEHISNIFDDLIALKLPKHALNGSDSHPANNYLVLERNTALDKINADTSNESSYNFNAVDLKFSNNLHNKYFSYATASSFNSSNSIMEMWNNAGNQTIRPYKIASLSIERNNAVPGSESASIEERSSNMFMAPRINQTGTTESIASGNNDVETIPNGLIYDIGIENNVNYTSIINEETPLDEYIPKAFIPIIRESNVMHQDSNFINRTNIFSFNENGNIFYSYIGSSCNDKDKSVVHIGSYVQTSHVISMGTESLTSNKLNDRSSLAVPDTLSIDLKNTCIKSSLTEIGNLQVGPEISVENIKNINDNLMLIRIDLHYIYDTETNQIITNFDNPDNNVLDLTINKTNLYNYISNKYKEHFSKLRINLLNNDNNDTEEINKKGEKLENNNLYIFSEPIKIFIIKNLNNNSTDTKIL